MDSHSVIFHHNSIPKDLVVSTGMNEVSWSYSLNTANYPTYGGEVVQILSVYIDDLLISGDVKTYEDMENIYTYFITYMIEAAQGSKGKGSYNQEPMKMTYPHREWTFYIQPLTVPGFTYSLETVAPKWELQAHIVDETAGNYQTLQEMTKLQTIMNHEKNLGRGETTAFELQGIISPAAADPANNPFSAPGEFTKNEEFSASTQQKDESLLKGLADFYNTLIPKYIEGDYSSIINNLGSKPAFGNNTGEGEGKTGNQIIKQAEETIK